MKHNKLKDERGIYLWAMGVMAVVFIGLFALVFGVNYITNGLSKYQEISDLASAAALNEFIRADAKSSYLDRANHALQGANRVLAANQIIGLNTLDGVVHDQDSSPNSQGTLLLGSWFDEDTGGDPCGGKYPCFIKNETPIHGGAGLVNAVQLSLNNDTTSNPLTSPLCNMFYGGPNCEQALHATSTVTVIPRCMAFLLDVSGSVHITTHKSDYQSAKHLATPSIWDTIPHCVSRNLAYCLYDPDDTNRVVYPSAPVLRYKSTLNPTTLQPLTPSDCTNANNYSGPESIIWCNMLPAPVPPNPIDPNRPVGVPPVAFEPEQHYWSDYVRRTVTYANNTSEDFLVDALVVPEYDYHGPEPFTGLMLGGNAGFRAIEATLTTSDMGRIENFSGKVTGSFPHPSSGQKMTPNFGALVQITNFENIGTILGTQLNSSPPPPVLQVDNPSDQELRPNFMDVAAFSPPTYGDPYASHTNALLAIEDAMQALSACPTNSRKLIFIATDMISSCARKSSVGAGSIAESDYTCEKKYLTSFQNSEGQMLDDADSLIARLRQNKISVSVLQAGDYLGMNYRNQKNSEGKYIDFLEAGARGMIGRYSQNPTCPSASNSFFNLCPSCASGTCTQEYAHNNAGKPGFFFREPIGIAADLALQTGGIYCPLMRTCNPGDYDATSGELLEECRDGTRDCDGDGDDNIQTCAPVNLSIGAQAAKCVLDALTGDPFKLVTEE